MSDGNSDMNPKDNSNMNSKNNIMNSPLARLGFVINGLYKVLPGINELHYQDDNGLATRDPVRLEPRIIHLLVLLAVNCCETVSRDFLLQEIWNGRIISDEALTQAISKLRSLFGESASKPRIIQTISKHGYRMDANVVTLGSSVLSTDARANATISITNSESTLSRNFPGYVKHLVTFLVILGFALGSWALLVNRNESTLSLESATKLSGNESGFVLEPTISFDGTQIAYVQSGDDCFSSSLYVRSLATEVDNSLTSEKGAKASLSWSPDGSTVAYCNIFEGRNEIRITSVNEKETRTLISCSPASYNELSWAPDGEIIAFCDRTSPKDPYHIYFTDVKKGSKRQITSAPVGGYGDRCPKFSPDGTRLAFIRAQEQRCGYLMILNLQQPDEIPRKIGKIRCGRDEIEWIDDNNIAFTAERDFSSGIWNISIESGTERYIGGQNVTSLSISHATSKLIYSANYRDFEILKRSLSSSTVEPDSSIRIVSSTVAWSTPDISPDGNHVAYISADAGSPELWICDSAGNNKSQLTYFGDRSIYNPSWSQEGNWIAFEVRHNDSNAIYRISSSGGEPITVIDDSFDNSFPSWSRNGASIYYCSDRSGKYEIWKSSIDRGTLVQVTEGGGLICTESPDERFLYFTRPDMIGVWRKPINSGDAEQLLSVGGYGNSRIFSPESDKLYFLDNSVRDTFTLSFFDFTSRSSSVKLLLGVAERGMYPRIAVDPFGKWMCYTMSSRLQSDAYIVEF